MLTRTRPSPRGKRRALPAGSRSSASDSGQDTRSASTTRQTSASGPREGAWRRLRRWETHAGQDPCRGTCGRIGQNDGAGAGRRRSCRGGPNAPLRRRAHPGYDCLAQHASHRRVAATRTRTATAGPLRCFPGHHSTSSSAVPTGAAPREKDATVLEVDRTRRESAHLMRSLRRYLMDFADILIKGAPVPWTRHA